VKISRLASILISITVLGLAAGVPSPAVAQGVEPPPEQVDLPLNSSSMGHGDYKPGEILVKFNPDALNHAAEGRYLRSSATSIETLGAGGIQLWHVPEGAELALIEQLQASPGVEYAELNHRLFALGAPDDPYYSYQWAHIKIQSPAAWDVTTGSASITIAIIDTGIDASHPDLAGNIVAGYDYVDDDSVPDDGYGHGTHVAGIAAATGDNSLGVAGMAWQARIMPVRVLDDEGSGWDSDVVQGITWACQHGAKILNLSLGGVDYSQAMQDTINNAHSNGCLVVAAMGNSRAENPTTYPAANDHVLAVAATNRNDAYAYYSQYGAHCDIAAPGGEWGPLSGGVYSTMPTGPVFLTEHYGYSNNYDYMQGTSMATPFVSGLAALVWAVYPSFTPDDIQGTIECTAVDLGPAGWDPDYGYGRISAQAAVLEALRSARVNDLHITQAVTDTTTLTATLSWSTPCAADLVALRTAATPIDDVNWEAAVVLSDSVSGTTTTYTAVVPFSGDTVYFALKPDYTGGSPGTASYNAFWPSLTLILPLIFRG